MLLMTWLPTKKGKRVLVVRVTNRALLPGKGEERGKGIWSCGSRTSLGNLLSQVGCSPLFTSGVDSYIRYFPVLSPAGAHPANGTGLRGSDEKSGTNWDRCSVYCLCETGNSKESVNQQLGGILLLSARDLNAIMYIHSFLRFPEWLLCPHHQVRAVELQG